MAKGIRLQNLSVVLNHRPLLKKVNLDIASGEVMMLMGQSGAGKSVLVKSVLGLIPLTQGHVHIGTQALSANQRPETSFYRSLGVVFQSCALFDSLTVGDNITFGLRASMTSAQRAQTAQSLLTHVELDPALYAVYPNALSGGMKRRVSIARAMATSPSFLFFDEPTEGLDPILSHTISLLIRKVCRQLNATALIICHDVHSALCMGDRIALLHQGQLAWQGAVQEVGTTTHPVMRQFVDLAQWPEHRP